MMHVYFNATLDGAELAPGEGRGRINLVEPAGPFEDDPNPDVMSSPATQPSSPAAARPCASWAD